MSPVLTVADCAKNFVMHLQDGLTLPVFSGVGFEVHAGECVVLGGASGVGKSSILKMIYGTYRVDSGTIRVSARGRETDVACAPPREVIRLRRESVAYVSQFLRVIPRVAAREIVAEPALASGASREHALERAEDLLRRLNVPSRLWGLPPSTFSGGEQQRINIARGFVADVPLLLLDEPTASLDATNRAAVVDLIEEKKRAGVAIVGIFHDDDVRHAVASRVVDVTTFAARPA